MDNVKMGVFIKELRKQKGLTQKQLGELLHVSEQAVSKWERGLSAPDISLLEPLSNILNVSISELVTGKKEMSDQTIKEVIQYSKHEIKSVKKVLWKRIIIGVLSILLLFPTFNDIIGGDGFSWRCLAAYLQLEKAAKHIVAYDQNLENYINDSTGMTEQLMALKDEGLEICDYGINLSRIRLDDMFLFLEIEFVVEYNELTYLLVSTGTYQNGKISFMHIYPQSTWAFEVPSWMIALNDTLCTYNPG